MKHIDSLVKKKFNEFASLNNKYAIQKSIKCSYLVSNLSYENYKNVISVVATSTVLSDEQIAKISSALATDPKLIDVFIFELKSINQCSNQTDTSMALIGFSDIPYKQECIAAMVESFALSKHSDYNNMTKFQSMILYNKNLPSCIYNR